MRMPSFQRFCPRIGAVPAKPMQTDHPSQAYRSTAVLVNSHIVGILTAGRTLPPLARDDYRSCGTETLAGQIPPRATASGPNPAGAFDLRAREAGFLGARDGHVLINVRVLYQLLTHETSCRHEVLVRLKTAIDREKFDFPADFGSVREGLGTCLGHLKAITGDLGGCRLARARRLEIGVGGFSGATMDRPALQRRRG